MKCLRLFQVFEVSVKYRYWRIAATFTHAQRPPRQRLT
jgi:hypothetical protein